MKRSLRSIFVLSLLLATLLPPVPAQSQTVIEQIQQLFTRRRPQGRAAGRSRGGAIRDECAYVGDRPLAALIPQSNVGKTLEERPTFWFYLPFGRSPQVQTARFMLLDESLNPVLPAPIPVTMPPEGGIVSFQLPETVPPLQVGQSYNWHFSVICNTDVPSANPRLSGWVERVAPPVDLNRQLANTLPQNQHTVYAASDLWFDTITQLARSKTTHPSEWAQLLELFDLEAIAPQAITALQVLRP